MSRRTFPGELYRVVHPGEHTLHKGPTSARFRAERVAEDLDRPVEVRTVYHNQPFLTALPPWARG